LKIIGIVGNIASGKTTVSKYFKKQGIPVIDADRVNRQVLKGKEIKKRVGEIFGIDVSQVTKKNIRSFMLKDDKRRLQLEKLLRPLVKEKVVKYVKFFDDRGYKFVAIETAVMKELNLASLIDQFVLVRADKDLRLERFRKKRSLSNDEAIKMLNIQADDELYLQYNPIVIDNNGGVEKFLKEVNRVIELIQ